MIEHSGVLIGVITDRDDPDHEGQVRVSFPTYAGSLDSHWAPIASPMGGNDRGFRFAPEEGDECLVMFDRGDPDHPYVVGFLHHGAAAIPAAELNQRIIQSVNGHTILMEDATPTNGNKGRMTIRDAHGNSVEMTNRGMTIRATGELNIDAPIVSIKGRPVIGGRGTI